MSFISDYFSAKKINKTPVYEDICTQTDDAIEDIKEEYNIISLNNIPIYLVTDNKLNYYITSEIERITNEVISREISKNNMIIKRNNKAVYIYKDGSLLYSITTKKLKVMT